MVSWCCSLLAAVVVGTWNGEWFPSGRAEHRANEKVEAAAITAAAEMVRAGLARQDPAGTNDLILCFNEIRDRETANALCAAIGRTNLAVAALSAYRRRDRFDMQQDLILTTLPFVSGNWSWWRNAKENRPPRGFAHAEIVLTPAVTAAVYAVHLKSDYGATTDEIREANRAKRLKAVEQLVDMTKTKRGKSGPPVIIAGDFNTDKGDRNGPEPIFGLLEKAKFTDALGTLDPRDRVTHPGHGKFPNGTLDYIMIRGLSVRGVPAVEPALSLSDHNAVFVTVQ